MRILIAEDDPVSRRVQRLRNNLADYNQTGEQQFKLSLSIGALPIAYNDKTDLDKQIAMADSAMYVEKRERRLARELVCA